jgi:hypothetical protein
MENVFSLSSANFQQNTFKASTYTDMEPSQWIQHRTVASTAIYLFEGNKCCQTSITNVNLWKT